MKTLNYATIIEQPPAIVFAVMTDKALYPEWAKAWGEGMTYTGEWQLGAHLSFLDEQRGGTKVVIEEFVQDKVIKCRHIAMVSPDNIEIQVMDNTMQKWVDTQENYYFYDHGQNATQLEVEMVTDEMFEGMMANWTIALQLLKVLCESGTRPS
ncbi:hypothetical protein [Planctobacterium marinum]|uniref:SRPBCC domain-containing protein n=1 Tax=Planctobacterium marinum TaxID=1631968 RepID=A0AA48KUX7_9ALTE|nr:hypothetical protein MACH26_24260 [Planctobacterium marinum]